MFSRIPIIEAKNVTKAYKSAVALDNVSLRIYPGEFICLVGPSGAGKSSLIRLLIREEVPSSGHIYVAGRDITELKPKEIPWFRRKIGVVFQDFKLLPHKNVAENIAFALEVCEATTDEITTRLPKILDLVGLKDRADNYPSELSGGEKQRTAIARALVHSPKVLLADEPTGNLDPDNAKDVIDLLRRINIAGTSVVLATHNKTLVDSLHKRVVRIEGGKLVSDKEGGYL